MIVGHVKIEIYEVDGHDMSGGHRTVSIYPYCHTDSSGFGGNPRDFLSIRVDGKTYTLQIDELEAGIGAVKLIARAGA